MPTGVGRVVRESVPSRRRNTQGVRSSSVSHALQPGLPTSTRVPERQNFQRSRRHSIVEVILNSAERQPTDTFGLCARRWNAEARLG
jgi:hypothetical protein